MQLSESSNVPPIVTPRGTPLDSRYADTNLLIVSFCASSLRRSLYFEVSEHGYGIALITDSKYGYAVQGNMMRISLLRGPMRPDADADRGKQAFSIAIYPHRGSYEQSNVQQVAEEFNTQLLSMSIPFPREQARLIGW